MVCALLTTGGTWLTSMYQADITWHHALCTRAQYMYENIWYVQGPDVHLLNTYDYMNAHVPFVAYVWRTCDFDLDIVCFILSLWLLCCLLGFGY